MKKCVSREDELLAGFGVEIEIYVDGAATAAASTGEANEIVVSGRGHAATVDLHGGD